MVRRPVAALLGILAVLLCTLTGCGQDPAGQPAGQAFATVEHLFGSTTVPSKPERVVALGGGDMEAAIALGVVPVAGADWFGMTTEPRTWVKTALGDRPAPKLIEAAEPNYEEIAAQAPDLILYVNSTNTKDVYTRLAKIAPTIAAPVGTKNVYGVGWQDQVRLIAAALGASAEGNQVVRRTERLIADTAKAHPRFAGRTITAGIFTSGRFSAWLPSDPRMHLLLSLGFKANPSIAAMDDGNFFVQLSDENVDRMNADLILLAAEDQSGAVDAKVTGHPVFKAVPAVRAGHVVYFGGAPVIMSNTERGAFSSAFSIGGPLGIPYVLEKLVPMLERGLAG